MLTLYCEKSCSKCSMEWNKTDMINGRFVMSTNYVHSQFTQITLIKLGK